MAIFDKSDSSSNTTLIAVGTKIDGEFHLKCKLHIDGEASGKVNSKSIVSIGKGGIFSGDLQANKLIVSGVFEGNAQCNSIELLQGGKILGSIISQDLMVETGSILECECQMKQDSQIEGLSASKDL